MLLRANLQSATEKDTELKNWARSANPADIDKAIGKLNEMKEKPQYLQLPIIQQFGHGQADYWLRQAQTNDESLRYTEEQLMFAGALVAAEFQMSRDYALDDIELNISPMLVAANDHVVGYWQGSLRGAISFLAEAGKAQGLKNDDVLVAREGWGLYTESDALRAAQALRDLRQFPSSLHLLAYRLGAWEVRLQGTQTAMSAAWILSYLFSFATKIPPQPVYPELIESQSSQEPATQGARPGQKRARGEQN